jgi:hypothetical protein
VDRPGRAEQINGWRIRRAEWPGDVNQTVSARLARGVARGPSKLTSGRIASLYAYFNEIDREIAQNLMLRTVLVTISCEGGSLYYIPQLEVFYQASDGQTSSGAQEGS